MTTTTDDWVPPTRRECLRCGVSFTSREWQPRCPTCGFRETPS
jgi:Zn finger protein HypA/HybF involved in hydrogenase expression